MESDLKSLAERLIGSAIRERNDVIQADLRRREDEGRRAGMLGSSYYIPAIKVCKDGQT
jgi:hypothetical protein